MIQNVKTRSECKAGFEQAEFPLSTTLGAFSHCCLMSLPRLSRIGTSLALDHLSEFSNARIAVLALGPYKGPASCEKYARQQKTRGKKKRFSSVMKVMNTS